MSGRSPRWFTGIQRLYEPNFADNTWAQIIETCQRKIIPPTWAVGAQKVMTINGTDYPIDIIGFNHDDYADGSGKAPITFQMHDIYGTRRAMNGSDTNAGGWASSKMRNESLPAILALTPPEVQSSIREVNKAAGIGNRSTTVETVSDKLFLLSETEVFNSSEFSEFSGVIEGTQYAYYATGGSIIKQRNGSADAWYLRSATIKNASRFIYVSTRGELTSMDANTGSGIAFAFCF